MLQFIKGDNLSKYTTLLGLTHAYDDAFFLDTTNTRLYYSGKPIDVRITVINEIGDDYFPKKSYQFTNDAGETTIISEAVIPDISDDNSIEFHNIETQEDTEISNGLLGARDKFLIEALIKIFNIDVEYTYYANVNHIQDEYSGDTTKMTDVIVYEYEPGVWVYAYDAFDYEYTVGSDTKTGHQEAGVEEVPADAVHIQSIKATKPADLNYYSDSNMADDKATISRHGGLPAGTTVATLEGMTLSEIFSKILFQSATPEKIKDTQAYLKFSEDYTGGSKYVEVGSLYPDLSKEDLVIEFIPETWQWSISDGTNTVYGAEQELVTLSSVKYYLIDYQHPYDGGHDGIDESKNIYDLESTGYQDHLANYRVADGDKSIYKAVVTYSSSTNAKDSDGNETYTLNGEEVYYAQGIDGSIETNLLRYTGAVDASTEIEVELNIVAGWKMYSNASNSSTNSLWEYKNTEPGEFEGNDTTINTDVFAQDGATLYLQWPSATTKSEHFYVYIPEGYSIGKVGGAHDLIEDNWTAVTTDTVDSSATITNGNNVKGLYNRFEISKASGITTVKIDIAKN